jgi:DNA-binding SARP family transcriptional activator
LRGAGGRLDVVLAQPKRLALLTYLALESRSGASRRDRILGIFWPELDQHRGRHALHQALHFLRRHLGQGVLLANGVDEIRVSSELLWCDGVAFGDAFASGDAATALELYRGDLLDGLYLSDAPEFEDWLEARRALLRTRAAESAWRMAHVEEAHGHPEQAVALGRRALELAASRSDEPAHQRFLGLLHRLGQSAAAVREYQAFRARLARELGLEPSPGLRQLVASIRQGAGAVGPTLARGLCRRARHFMARRTAEGLALARRDFLAATEASPQDPLGYAGLAEVCALLPWYAGVDTGRARSWAEAAAARALELDHDLAAPHTIQAAVSFWFSGDRRWADDRFRQAMDLDPGYSTTHHWYALTLVERGQFEAAVEAARVAWILDPASVMVGTDYATVLFWARQHGEALRQIESALELEPQFYLAHQRRWRIQAALGRYEDAAAAMITALRLECIREQEIDAVQEAWATRGWEGVLYRRLDQTVPLARGSGAAALDAGLLCGMLGRGGEALDWLERARACCSPGLGLRLREPAFDAFRATRPFGALLRSVLPRS